MIYDELIEELALTLLTKARYEGCISVIDGFSQCEEDPQLCRGLFAGRGDCLVLHYFFRHLVQPARRGYRCICGDGCLDVCWRVGI